MSRYPSRLQRDSIGNGLTLCLELLNTQSQAVTKCHGKVFKMHRGRWCFLLLNLRVRTVGGTPTTIYRGWRYEAV
jgi:hypothetical protein